MSTYILQKDLPDLKAGAEFTKVDSKLFPIYVHNVEKNYNGTASSWKSFSYEPEFVENNPEWFLPKEEKIKVGDFTYILQKDLPEAKANTEYIVSDSSDDVFYVSDKESWILKDGSVPNAGVYCKSAYSKKEILGYTENNRRNIK